MAFTSAEKRQIRSYLGYSGGFRDRGVRLESMMDVVGAQVEESAYARVLLGQIEDIDEAIIAGGSTTTATYGALKKVDEIEFHPVTSESGSTETLTGESLGEVLIERLRALFDVPLNGRYFRSGGSAFVPVVLG